jgi:hypothetical protein
MNKSILLIILAISLFSCKTTRVDNPDGYRGKQIVIGSGGGATGQTTTWMILDNGQVFKQLAPEGIPDRVRTLGKQKAAGLFELVEGLNPETEPFNHPGNLTHFIGINKAGKTSLIKWGEPNVAVPEKYTNTYNRVMSVIQP